MLNKSNNFNIL